MLPLWEKLSEKRELVISLKRWHASVETSQQDHKLVSYVVSREFTLLYGLWPSTYLNRIAFN